MTRPSFHKWGRKVHPMLNNALLSEASVNRMLIPLHMAVTMISLNQFTREHADNILKVINLVAVDSASRNNGMWQLADRAGEIIIAMSKRDQWAPTREELDELTEKVLQMDKYMRTWTNRRLTVAAVTVDKINHQAKANGKQFLDRVELR